MKAKTFGQFILENLNLETFDELLGWLHEAPYYSDAIAPLWAGDFIDIRAQFEEELMQYPDLEPRLQLDEIFIRPIGTEEARGWAIDAEWSQDPEEEEIDEADFPDSITIMALDEVRDEEELIAALEQMQQAVLDRMALDENLGEEWLEQVVDLGSNGVLSRLCKNPATTTDMLLKVVAKAPELRPIAEKHPNWPEDITDWALGDW